MKNYFTIIPGLREWRNYFIAIKYKILNKGLIIGKNCELKNVRFSMYNALGENCTIKNVSIGNHSYISSNSKINNTNIGNFCSIGPNCHIGLGKHPTNEFISTHPIFYSTQKQSGNSYVNKNSYSEFAEIKIGSDVWIGANVIIMDGVTIGDGAIIGAKALITKDVSPFSIVIGIPGKLVKKRFSDNIIEQLMEIKWWLKPDDWIKKNSSMFLEKEKFLAFFNQDNKNK